MSKQNAAQAQKETQQEARSGSKPNPMNDPFTFFYSGFDAWAQMTKENIDRIQSFYDELADFEDAAYGRAKKGAQDLGEMMSESMTYLTDLTREWRKLTLEATRRSTRMFGPRA